MSLPLGLDDVRIWLWLASVWGGGWLWSKAPILQPYLFYRFVGDMSDGDLRALVLVVGVANFGLVYAAFFGIPFFGVAPLLFDIVLFFGSDDAFFWSGPISLAFGGIVCVSAHAVAAIWRAAVKTESDKRLLGKHAKYLAEKNAIFDFVKRADGEIIMAMLTLNNRKVYIGWPRRVSDWKNPNPSNQHLYFLPLNSGYRKQDSQEVVLTTEYFPAYDKFVGHDFDDMNDYRAATKAWEIIIPVNEIILAQPFDPDVYKVMQSANPAPKPKSPRKKKRKK